MLSSNRCRNVTWRSWDGSSWGRLVFGKRGRGRTMPSTTIFKRGQVVVVDVPFSDQSGTKPRPAMIISADAFHRDLPDVIVCPISSQPRHYNRPGPGDCPLQGWRAI